MEQKLCSLAFVLTIFGSFSWASATPASAQKIEVESNGTMLKLEEAKYVSGDNCEAIKKGTITLVDDLYMKIMLSADDEGHYLNVKKVDVGPDKTNDTEELLCNIDLKFSSSKKIKLLFSNTVLWGKSSLAPGHKLDLDLNLYYKNRSVGEAGLYYSERNRRQKVKWRPHTFGMRSKPRNFDRCLDDFTIRLSLFVSIGGESTDKLGSQVSIWELGTEQEVSALDLKLKPDESKCN